MFFRMTVSWPIAMFATPSATSVEILSSECRRLGAPSKVGREDVLVGVLSPLAGKLAEFAMT